MIIDSRSYTNVTRIVIVYKLNLHTTKYHILYKL
jgi:hypothetical protein